MTVYGPFVGAAVWCDLADLSPQTNEVTLQATVKPLDATPISTTGWATMVPGLATAKVDLKGFFAAGSPGLPDDLFFGDVGVGGLPITVVPQGPTVGNLAYLTTVTQPDYKPGGKIGDLLTFDTSKVADARLVRGQVANVTARTATATTTALQLSAPTAAQRVVAAVHVLSATASSSLTVAIQGDSSSSFPSPATVVTGAAITAAGSQYLKGPVGVTADTWYRLSLTITGSSPSFLLYAAIGVG